MYTDFARVYDRLMRDVPYAEWAAYYLWLLRENGYRDGPVAECACGTGSLTVELAPFIPRLTGLDQSGAMLALAMEKARDRGLMIPFVRQDMRALALPGRVSAVLATCDGVNYLTGREDALAFFRAAYRALRPGGVLCFDVSSAYKLEKELGSCVRAVTEDDLCYIWQSSYREKARLLDIRVDVFERTGQETYRRVTEEQTQRAYTAEELAALLEQAGFTAIRFYGDRTKKDPGPAELRLHAAAVREQ